MSKYLLDKFLYTVDRVPELVDVVWSYGVVGVSGRGAHWHGLLYGACKDEGVFWVGARS